MAKVKLKSGQTREFQRVEFDKDGGTVKAIEDHQVVDTFPAFHVAALYFEDGVVYVMDEPDEDW